MLCVFCLMITTTLMAQDKMKLIYVGDPMCSWCYGIAEEWTAVYNQYKDKAEIEMVMGGLRPYYDEKMINMKSFLSHHWEDVHKASGQEFNYDILDRPDLAYDTEPPCRAVVVVKSLAPGKEVPFFKLTQRDFYFHNKDMNLAASYHDALKQLEISTSEFDEAFQSEKYKAAVKDDFQRARALGVNSFPTILMEKDGKISVIARGYSKSQNIIAEINKQ